VIEIHAVAVSGHSHKQEFIYSVGNFFITLFDIAKWLKGVCRCCSHVFTRRATDVYTNKCTATGQRFILVEFSPVWTLIVDRSDSLTSLIETPDERLVLLSAGIQ